jgi:hypothetical protein
MPSFRQTSELQSVSSHDQSVPSDGEAMAIKQLQSNVVAIAVLPRRTLTVRSVSARRPTGANTTSRTPRCERNWTRRTNCASSTTIRLAAIG